MREDGQTGISNFVIAGAIETEKANLYDFEEAWVYGPSAFSRSTLPTRLSLGFAVWHAIDVDAAIDVFLRSN